MFRRRLSLLSGPDKLAALDSQGSSTLKKRLGRCSVAATVIHDVAVSYVCRLLCNNADSYAAGG